uniref:V-type proton ATPase subunit E n=2 Tax=Phlebotomus papatasi TaxID=29031 RepID=A0A1B0DBL4_PHLPP
MEPNVLVKTRQVDQNIVQSVLPRSVEEYKDQIGKDVVVTLDTENYLPADACGGIELSALNGRIRVPNTLESRLELISAQLLPAVRTALFGRNANRKFTD